MTNPSVTRISVFGASMFFTASISARSDAIVMSPSDVLCVATVTASFSTDRFAQLPARARRARPAHSRVMTRSSIPGSPRWIGSASLNVTV